VFDFSSRRIKSVTDLSLLCDILVLFSVFSGFGNHNTLMIRGLRDCIKIHLNNI
jgi:hypothetical protein